MQADFIQHLTHALDVCGDDHVGLGPDSVIFSATAADLEETRREVAARRQAGVNAPGENRLPYIPDLDTPRKLEIVADALLQHGYSARVTEKVLGLNFSRVFGEIWAA
jgi:membrane dipeptidase